MCLHFRGVAGMRQCPKRATKLTTTRDDSQAMIKSQSKRYYIFGLFRVDITERLLFGERGVVPLTPKAFDTLMVLIENSKHVLSKDELMQMVWPDSFVEENNLAQNISALRKALGETSGGQKYIETMPKRGYRFVADVRESAVEAGGGPQTWPDNRMQPGSSERPQRKGSPFSREVVIIGRAIDFK